MNAQIQINGQVVCVDADNRMLLVDYLRNTLHLKGTRYGCGEEQCGACVVLVNGAPRASCQIEVGHVVGTCVTTVEELENSRPGRVLLEAFEEFQAGQCAFCLSGILMRALSMLHKASRSNEPSRNWIVDELAPHLCRCGAHPRILMAVEAACQRHLESAK